MTKDKLVCTWAWRENEGDANKNYFVSLGSAAWISQELIFFTRSALPLGSSKNFTALLKSSNVHSLNVALNMAVLPQRP